MSRLALGAQCLASVCVACLTVAGATAQPTSIPDFSLNQPSWVGGIGWISSPSPVRRARCFRIRPILFVPNNSGARPTYRIADLSYPNLKQWAKDIMKTDNDEVLVGKIAFTPRQSCMPAGVPGFILYGGGSVYFLQASKEVTMIFDGDMQVRHVYMDVPHSAYPKTSVYG